MEKVALMSSVVICLIFVLGSISSHLNGAKRASRFSIQGKSLKPNDDLMAGIIAPNNPTLAGASFGGSGIGSITDNRTGMQEVSAKAVGE